MKRDLGDLMPFIHHLLQILDIKSSGNTIFLPQLLGLIMEELAAHRPHRIRGHRQ
eukprot:CAMPEP_0197042426 /NCGR_PEP_ID=MMETSP1384-20130603/18806_1 /TAXON_ID=29189 /ORGANISM="Ammonia sp." /LENGTH=54 /DNA_ID=CAMNT_0042473527 /DNA_START=87 /DNA_END=248 /DNA_ORIENTATION=+